MCASVFVLDGTEPLGTVTVLLGTGASCATAGAFFALKSSAQDFGAAGRVGGAFGVSSESAPESGFAAVVSSF
jgi:hypothetical protein